MGQQPAHLARAVAEKRVGRPKGSVSSYSKAGRELARSLLSGKTYRDRLERRLEKGELSPAMETHLWNMAYGRPPDSDYQAKPRAQGAVINVITSSPATEKQIGSGRTTTIVTSQPSERDNTKHLATSLDAVGPTGTTGKISQPVQPVDSPDFPQTKKDPAVVAVSSPQPRKKSAKRGRKSARSRGRTQGEDGVV